MTQEESFQLSGYRSDRARQIFLNAGIEHRHFYFEGEPRLDESADELTDRYARGAVDIGSRAVRACLAGADLTPDDIDLLVVCTSTGFVCPDIGSRLIRCMRLRPDVQRASLVGLGCAAALPALQRACDFAEAHPGRIALVLAVEICSACYFVDDTLETVVGNAICADGASAVAVTSGSRSTAPYPRIVDFESLLEPDHLDLVGFDHMNGKLRVVLGSAVRDVGPALIRRALVPLLERHGLTASGIRFWVAHPGGRKVIGNVQRTLALSDDDVRFSASVLRQYGNMSSPTVLFVLDEVVRCGNPRSGDWGVMTTLGPGMAAELALLRW